MSKLNGVAEVGVHEVKTNLSRLLQRVAMGEEIVITNRGRPVAQLVSLARSGDRVFGADVGKYEVPDDFNNPLPPDVLADFEG